MNKIKVKTREDLDDVIAFELKWRGASADLNHIDVSGITNMSYLFNGLEIENIKIDEWDVSNVTDMRRMFDDCKKFNADLSKWNVSKVTDMCGMFASCENFNSDLSKWNVSIRRISSTTFYGCTALEDKHKPKLRK